MQRWEEQEGQGDQRKGPDSPAAHAYSEEEQQAILNRINQPDYAHLTPAQIVCKEADQGRYLASERTIYRILKKHGQDTHRHRSKERQPRKKPSLLATGPNQVWVWDITYLPLNVRGHFAYLYWVMDLYSRKIVGWRVYPVESMECSKELLSELIVEHGLAGKGLTIHSDNGSPMKGSAVVEMLRLFGVERSLSRPGVSNDNGHCESSFRTLKYRHNYPRYQENKEAWSQWVSGYVTWYNEEHMHSGIGYVTPQARHEGSDHAQLEGRRIVYQAAYEANPQRWRRGKPRGWERPETVHLIP